MQSRGTVASTILMSIVVALMTTRGYARLGEDLRIDELLASADVVCAGRIVGCEAVEVASELGGTNSMWVAMRFAVDHKIKSSVPTNDLMILMKKVENPEIVKDMLARAQPDTQKRQCRFIVFLKTSDIKMSQFKFVDYLDGMIPVSSKIPSIERDAGTEKRIEDEMNQRLKELDPANQTAIKTMLERWQKGSHAVTNKQEEVGGRH